MEQLYHDKMTLGDQILTQSYMGYTDPNTGMSNKDPFGINVRSAFGNYYYEPEENEILLGDLNFDGIVNVIDVVSLVNGILGAGFTDEQFPVADINGDSIINVIDIVSLVNSILG